MCDDEHPGESTIRRAVPAAGRSTTLRTGVESLSVERAKRRSGSTWRRTALGCVVGCGAAALTSSSAVAAAPSSTTPEQLWRAYPLEQTVTSGSGTSARPPVSRPSAGGSPSTAKAPEHSSGAPWIALVVAIVGAGLAVVALRARRRPVSPVPRPGPVAAGDRDAANTPRSPGVAAAAMPPGPRWAEQAKPPASRPAARARTGPTPSVAHLKPTPPPNGLPRQGSRTSGAGRVQSRPRAGAPPGSPAPPPPAAKARGPAGAAPGNKAAGPGIASGNGVTAKRDRARATAARKGPICQIRWWPTGRGSHFRAVTVGPDGVERTVATSPRLDWGGPSPPEQSREAQAALRHLAKQLRESGWRPMRAKGKDFDEERWYARRFRQPEPAAEESVARSQLRRVQ
jgi:hypothetical protein